MLVPFVGSCSITDTVTNSFVLGPFSFGSLLASFNISAIASGFRITVSLTNDPSRNGSRLLLDNVAVPELFDFEFNCGVTIDESNRYVRVEVTGSPGNGFAVGSAFVR